MNGLSKYALSKRHWKLQLKAHCFAADNYCESGKW